MWGRIWGEEGSLFSPDLFWRALESLLSIAVIFALAGLAVKLGGAAVDRLFRVPEEGSRLGVADERRAKTLNSLTRSILQYLIFFLAGVATLDELGIDTRSIVAAAGILGLAVGFGAQNLVRDFVTGFFILFEDQYAVGDYVTVAGVSGIVESVGIRTTRVRDLGGELHIIPNGKVEQVTNHMGPGMRVLFTVRVPYEEDVDRVIEALEALFERLRGEMENLVEGPSVLGVQDFGDAGVDLLIWAKAKPMTQWATGRELRREVRRLFVELGIKTPYPRHYVMMTGTNPPSPYPPASPGQEPAPEASAPENPSAPPASREGNGPAG